MTELLTAAQMRAIERNAIESGQATGLDLMERAGRGVVDAAFAEWPELGQGAHRAIVLCGPGNNGGDGFVIARLLAERGWTVDAYLFGDIARLPADAHENCRRWLEMGRVHPLVAADVNGGPRPDLIIDAVFGIGLTRPLPEEVAQALNRGRKTAWKAPGAIRTVAVDCPSGLDLDTGMIPFDGDAEDPDFDPWPKTLVTADLTVTFHAPKPGHYLGLGPTLCGKIAIADIGLRGEALERSAVTQPPDPERARLAEPVLLNRPLKPRMWPLGEIAKFKGLGGHKFEHGHVAVFAGGVGRGGAGRLAARAALRAGAGLVTLLCPPAALQENAARLDAVMLRAIKDAEGLGDVADARVTAFCLGPGLGVSERTRALVGAVLARRAGEADWRDPAVVLDADALTVFADDPQALFGMAHERTILTPHEGEFARLFPDLAQSRRGGRSKIDVARIAAARAGCIVLLKGVDTVIAAPDGGASVHAAAYGRAAPWLATAGAGDVLAGLIAGLAASPLSAELFNMAEIAAWLHVECARSFGPGLIAEDLPEELPKVFRALGS